MLSQSDTPTRSDPTQPDNPHAAGVIPEVVPPLPRPRSHARDLPWRTAFGWLRLGWRDLWTAPLPSLAYGLGVFLVSLALVWGLFRFEADYALFPALAGFLVVGPMIAAGLYEKSRRIEEGLPVGLPPMLFVRLRSGPSGIFAGVMLLGLFLLWMRAAVLIYALFFGMVAFPGTDEILPMLLLTPTGWALLLVGAAVGALFAAFAFAIGVFSMPMLLAERTDALSALAISMAMVWANRPVMIAWGAITAALFALSLLTLGLALILVFPLLGHATWHAYRTLRAPAETVPDPRMFIPPA
ncbi:DUF2189 domain-containing protein [Mesobaculum littorinae]|uniref:DUF2189 domain-containing protein n=1 Tax=Mesobaculum littorinae TaxID=2486419 RepID=A0A438ADJ6_9RHOB|nr:DUF2189 domain-containing protein [Mesobaculum littorinae]RVV96712.1 DUF2189 domain-containing protein [Mesobaculum littorinae]